VPGCRNQRSEKAKHRGGRYRTLRCRPTAASIDEYRESANAMIANATALATIVEATAAQN